MRNRGARFELLRMRPNDHIGWVFSGPDEADALEKGYSGIRVAADNTPLVTEPERLEAWIRWEIIADRFMSENRVTGLCAFNRERVDVDTLRHLSTLHPLSSAECPTPQFLLFSEEGALYIEGEVDSLAIEQVLLALQNLPPKTNVVVDLTKTALITKAAMRTLHQLLVSGIGISLRGASEAARNIGAIVGMPIQCFS